MSELIGTIGTAFKTAAPAIEGGTAAAGLFGNLMNSISRSKQVGQLQSAEKKFADLTPEQLSSLVTRAEQPLGQDLLQSVGNTVQADMATRGLSQAPGIFAASETQALAPYKLQEQQMALQAVLQQMGLPIEYADSIIKALGPNVDVSKILALLNSGGSGGGGGFTLPQLDNLIWGNGTPDLGNLPTALPSSAESDPFAGALQG